MPLDFRYDQNDRVLGDDGNYETTPGQADMMIREMQSDVIDIDGDEYGNRAFKETQRGFDSGEHREIIKRYYEEVGQRYVDGGGIKDLEVTVDDAEGLDGLAIGIKAWDVMRNQAVDTALAFIELD